MNRNYLKVSMEIKKPNQIKLQFRSPWMRKMQTKLLTANSYAKGLNQVVPDYTRATKIQHIWQTNQLN